MSAPIATQVEKAKPKDPNKLGKKAAKRKEKQEQEVNADNIGEYWDKVVDTKDGKDAKDAKKAAPVAVAQNGVEDTGDGAQEKRGKKRKRGKSGKDKQEDGDEATKGNKTAPAVEPETADTSTSKPTTADSESKRDKKKRKRELKEQNGQVSEPTTEHILPKSTDLTVLIPTPANLTPLQKSMRQKLASARFRHLNESLYTKPSADSLSLFKDDPSMFEDYHRGFAQQVEVWPSNPVDGYVDVILARAKVGTASDKARASKNNKRKDSPPTKPKPLPHSLRPPYSTTIADLGCGTASLSYRLQPHLPNLNLTLHSYDLSQPTGPSAPLVTIADISALPLKDSSVDVAIFCLALMGTNWLDFIDEAYRVLRWKGELWVSEIKSRFGRVERKGKGPVNSVGSLKKSDRKKKTAKDKTEEEGPLDSDDEKELATAIDGQPAAEGTDLSSFIDVLKKRGFVLDALPETPQTAIDLSNKMFVKMQFVKGAQPTRGKNVKPSGVGFGGKTEADDKKNDRMKFGMKGKKFNVVGDEGDARDDEAEKRVLKPCLYKIR